MHFLNVEVRPYAHAERNRRDLIHVLTLLVPRWPEGSFALPRPAFDCPAKAVHNWTTGITRIRQVPLSDGSATSSWSDNFHQLGPYGPWDFTLAVCAINTDSYLPGAEQTLTWPAGSYCIYKIGRNCPTGLFHAALLTKILCSLTLWKVSRYGKNVLHLTMELSLKLLDWTRQGVFDSHINWSWVMSASHFLNVSIPIYKKMYYQRAEGNAWRGTVTSHSTLWSWTSVSMLMSNRKPLNKYRHWQSDISM